MAGRLLRIELALSDDPDCDPPTTLLDPVSHRAESELDD
jgi:hypothetical protein